MSRPFLSHTYFLWPRSPGGQNNLTGALTALYLQNHLVSLRDFNFRLMASLSISMSLKSVQYLALLSRKTYKLWIVPTPFLIHSIDENESSMARFNLRAWHTNDLNANVLLESFCMWSVTLTSKSYWLSPVFLEDRYHNSLTGAGHWRCNSFNTVVALHSLLICNSLETSA